MKWPEEHTSVMIEQVFGFAPLTDRPQRLYDVWDRWRGERTMPSRADVLPEELRDLLRYIVLMETAPDPADCRYIISGTAVDAASNRSLKGFTVRDVLSMGIVDSLSEVTSHYAAVMESQRPSFSRGSMDYRDRGYIAFDRVLLPLSNDEKAVDHLLCGFFYNVI